MMIKQSTDTQRGFTLVELMIALTLFSVAIAGVLSVAVTVTQGYREQHQAVAAESAVRAPLDYLADAIRQSSPGASNPAVVQDFNTCFTGAITLSNNTGLNGSDVLEIFYASGGFVTATTELFDSSSGVTLKVFDSSKLVAGDSVMVTDYTTGFLAKISAVGACVSGVCTLTLATRCSGTLVWPGAGFPASSVVVRAQHAKFSIGTVEGVTTLMMDPDGTGGGSADEPFAEGIEDMQVALASDTDGDGAFTDAASASDEWFGNHTGDGAPTAAVRAVRITLIAQTKTALVGQDTGLNVYNRPAAEDHVAGASDRFRRRLLKTTVDLRNVAGSK